MASREAKLIGTGLDVSAISGAGTGVKNFFVAIFSLAVSLGSSVVSSVARKPLNVYFLM